VRGNVKDYAAVKDALQFQHAVLVVLGAKSPFTRDRVLIKGIGNIVRAMESKGVKRIIYLSFAGVADSQKQLGLFRFIAGSLLSSVVRDHEEKEKIIQRSSLEWTIVRPALLTNSAHTGKFKSGEGLTPKLSDLMIARADVADFMLRQLDSNVYLRRAPLLSR
jgi:putative NADH-flavin reductase